MLPKSRSRGLLSCGEKSVWKSEKISTGKPGSFKGKKIRERLN